MPALEWSIKWECVGPIVWYQGDAYIVCLDVSETQASRRMLEYYLDLLHSWRNRQTGGQ